MKTPIEQALRAALLAVSLGWIGAQPALAQAFNTNALMLTLSAHPPGKATFVETKTLALLKKPIVSEGELRYEPPGKLTMDAHAQGRIHHRRWRMADAPGRWQDHAHQAG